MRITLRIKGNIYNIMRQLGYCFEKTEKEELAFSKQVSSSGSGFPRFHIFAKQVSQGTFEINIHLDQKKPAYKGAPAHSGEYQGELVEKEAQRIKQIIKGL